MEDTAKVEPTIYARAEVFIGKTVTLRNVKFPSTTVTGVVTEAKVALAEEESDTGSIIANALQEFYDSKTYVSEIRIQAVGMHQLLTQYIGPYAAKEWYWTVESIV